MGTNVHRLSELVFIIFMCTITVYSSNETPILSGAFSGTIINAAGYNNNIYDHTRIRTTSYGKYTIENNTTIVSDLFFSHSGWLEYRHPSKNPALLWSTTFSFFDKRYQKHSDLNLLQIGLESGLDYVFTDSVLSFPLFFKRLWYGGTGYLYTYGVSPKYTLALDKDSAFSIELNAYKKHFVQHDKQDWNSNHLDAAIGFQTLSHSGAMLYGKTGLISERRTQGKRTDVSYNGAFLSGTFLIPLWSQAYADLGFRVEHRAFLHKHPNLALRKDTRVRLDAGIVQPLSETFSAKINYTYIKNTSTINAYTHKSDTITVSLTAHF
jgi:hypothetical protein